VSSSISSPRRSASAAISTIAPRIAGRSSTASRFGASVS
jgi:hypothetical protein